MKMSQEACESELAPNWVQLPQSHPLAIYPTLASPSCGTVNLAITGWLPNCPQTFKRVQIEWSKCILEYAGIEKQATDTVM